MNFRMGALLSVLLAVSMACAGSKSSPDAAAPDGNVTIGFSTAAALPAPGADVVRVAWAAVAGQIGCTAGGSQDFSQTLGTTLSARPILNLAACTYDVTVTALNGTTPVGVGVGKIVVPASGPVLATIKVANGPVAPDAPSIGFIVTSFTGPAGGVIGGAAPFTAPFSISGLAAPATTLTYNWSVSPASCVGTPPGTNGAWMDGAAIVSTAASTGPIALASIQFVSQVAQVCTVSVTVSDGTASRNVAKSMLVGFGANVGIAVGDVAPPTITSVIVYDEGTVTSTFGGTCSVKRPTPAYPALPLGCAAADGLAAGTAVGATTFSVTAGNGAIFPASGSVRIDSGASLETRTYTRVGDVFTVPALSLAHTSGKAVALVGPTSPPSSTLAAAGALGATSVTLAPGTAASFAPAGSFVIDAGTATQETVSIKTNGAYLTPATDVFTLNSGLQFAHAAGATIAAVVICEFPAIKASAGTDVCIPNSSATFPFLGATDEAILFVQYNLNGAYDAANPPAVSMTSSCSAAAPFPVTPGETAQLGASTVTTAGIDPVQWYQTSANSSLVGAYVGTAQVLWAQPSGPPPASGPVTCTLTARINNQGAVDTFPLYVWFQ